MERSTETVPPELTPREREVLALLAGGLTDREIAGELGYSEHTVACWLADLYPKLGARNRAHAVALAYQLGVL